jgi:hypothetical protein
MDDVGASPLFNDLPTSPLAQDSRPSSRASHTGMAIIDVLYGLGL